MVCYFHGSQFVSGVVEEVDHAAKRIMVAALVIDGAMCRPSETLSYKDILQVQRPEGKAVESAQMALQEAENYNKPKPKPAPVKDEDKGSEPAKTTGYQKGKKVAALKPGKKRDARLPDVGTNIIVDYKGSQVCAVEQDDGTFKVTKGSQLEGIFKSLSAAAKAITGSTQNGFRWFNLGNKK